MAGDESNSMMSYVDLNWDFSQFDQDNFNRAQTAGYIIAGNAIAKDVLESSRAADGLPALQRADEEFGIAAARLPITTTLARSTTRGSVTTTFALLQPLQE
jgi:hypothetical protein